MKIYVSGPITGYLGGNLDAFEIARTHLLSLGHKVVVPHDVPPHEHDGTCPRGYAQPATPAHDDGHSSNACYVRADIEAELRCDAIYLLAGWEYSVGARAEFEVAAITGLTIYYEDARRPEEDL